MPGGVCAVLDYEVDVMAEYVAEMAMRIVMPNSSVTPAFRKFVSQILTSTRLPSTTILLGMNFLAKRINMLNAQGHFKAPEGQVWRMLTVSLLLGSKFLDDNTFQNRSWSEVSGIPVIELNQIEFEWLKHINWHLYVNLDESKDYTAWLKNWADWSDNKKHQQAQLAQQQSMARERLAPIVTNIQTGSRRSHHGPAYQGWSPDELHDAEAFNTRLLNSTKAYRQRENTWQNQYQGSWAPQAPLTPPDSGYGTPEYLNSAPPVNSRFDWPVQAAPSGNYNRAYANATNSAYSSSRGAMHYHQPYFSHYPQGGWESNLAECNCHNCFGSAQSKPNYYMPHHAYGQAVMG